MTTGGPSFSDLRSPPVAGARRPRRWAGRRQAVALAMLLILFAQGCTVAKNMRVRSGNDPRYRDEEVRFRTTYYFRVFDACDGIGRLENNSKRTDTVFGGKVHGPYHLLTDSLYRFRMTGKANSLFQRVRFESGSLRKEQIDPFGSNVVYDTRTNRFVYSSREETEAEARRLARFDDIKTLRDLRNSLDKTDDAVARQEVDRIIQQQVRGLAPVDVLQSKPAVRALPTAAGEVALVRDRAQGLGKERSGLAVAADAIRKRVEEVKAQRPALGKDSVATTALGDLGQVNTALTDLDSLQTSSANLTGQAAVKGQEAQKAADEAALALKGKTESKDDPEKKAARAYGDKAAEFAASVNAASVKVTETAAKAREAATNGQKALDRLAPAIGALKAEDDPGGLARQSLGELAAVVGRLRAQDAAWQELAERAATQAAAAGQIAATASFFGLTTARETPASAGPDLVVCPGGTPSRRGFQILGPEGWRTFDQEERLLMVMYSSAKPLTSTLQQLSNNVLNAQQVPAEALLPLVRERLRIVETLNTVERYEAAGGTPDQVVNGILATFGRNASGGAR